MKKIFSKNSLKATNSKKRFLSLLLCSALILGSICVNATSINIEDLEQSDKTLDLEQGENSFISFEDNDSSLNDSILFEDIDEDRDSILSFDEIDSKTENETPDTIQRINDFQSEIIDASNSNSLEAMGIELYSANTGTKTKVYSKSYNAQAGQGQDTRYGKKTNTYTVQNDGYYSAGMTVDSQNDSTKAMSANIIITSKNTEVYNKKKNSPGSGGNSASVASDIFYLYKDDTIKFIANCTDSSIGYDYVINVYSYEETTYSHTLSYDANGGSNAPSSSTVTNTSSTYSMTVSSSQPTRSGYSFAGWNTNSGGTGTNYSAGNSISVGANSTVTLYAKWTPVYNYTIQFNANGGSGSVPSTITKSGTDSSVTMGDISNTVPTRTNYTFKGWSASPNGTNRIAYSGVSGATTTSNSWSYATYCSYTGGDSSNRTLTLYAVWEYNPPTYSHTLAYNANGGSNAPSSSTVTNTSSTYSMTVSSSQPTRTGYTFAGWNTNSNGTGTNYSAGNSVSVGANSTVTLYAKWNSITYSIAYNGNGNTGGSTDSQTKTYGVAINLQNNGFTKTGYHFTGWNTASNGTGTSYSAGASYSSNANLALYAQWAINSSILSVNPNGGTWNNSTATQSFTQNYNTTKAISIPTRTGYTFTGWTRSGTNGTMSSLTGSATYTFGTSNGTTDTITAGWKVNNYTVTYIDVIDSKTGKELGRSTDSKPYNSTVRGSDKGNSTADNVYYNGYYYVSDTSATVATSGATVYRIFKQRMTNIAGNIIWDDWNNKNLSRPSSVNFYITGSDGSKYSYVITGNHGQNTSVNNWGYNYSLPKYGNNGNVIVYTVSQDKAISQEEGLYYEEPVIVGYNITNKITNTMPTEDYPVKVSVSVTWDDNNDFYGFRPENAAIQLLRNGIVIKTSDVSDNYTFTDLLKYDSNGDKYVYTIQAPDEKRYTKVENNSAPYNKTVTYTFVESYFSVLIPKQIVLDGTDGTADYTVSATGAFYYNDTLTVKPASSFILTDRNNISSMTGSVNQPKTGFTKEDGVSSGSNANGSISVNRTHFAGLWNGHFNFDIKFKMMN